MLQVVRRVEHAEIDLDDPVTHRLRGAGLSELPHGDHLPESNFALITPRARRQLHLELAALGWWLPWADLSGPTTIACERAPTSPRQRARLRGVARHARPALRAV
jgi:hypothetical protein